MRKRVDCGIEGALGGSFRGRSRLLGQDGLLRIGGLSFCESSAGNTNCVSSGIGGSTRDRSLPNPYNCPTECSDNQHARKPRQPVIRFDLRSGELVLLSIACLTGDLFSTLRLIKNDIPVFAVEGGGFVFRLLAQCFISTSRPEQLLQLGRGGRPLRRPAIAPGAVASAGWTFPPSRQRARWRIYAARCSTAISSQDVGRGQFRPVFEQTLKDFCLRCSPAIQRRDSRDAGIENRQILHGPPMEGVR
jgi:hypothetical protein